jgi:hypothetical protein
MSDRDPEDRSVMLNFLRQIGLFSGACHEKSDGCLRRVRLKEARARPMSASH